MISTEKKLSVIELRAQGLSVQKIASKVGISKQSVVDIIREGREQVAALEALNLDTLYEAMKITTTERIKNLAILYAKLKAEVENRELSLLPTEKLIDLYLRTSQQLDGAMVAPDLRSEQEQQDNRAEREILEEYSSL